MDLGIFYEKHKQFYYSFLSRKLNDAGLPYHAEDIIHDAVVAIIANEKHREIFENFSEEQAKAYFTTCLLHRMIDMIRREKRCQNYIKKIEIYEQKQEMETCTLENMVLEHMAPEDILAEAFRLLSREERELLTLVFVQKLPYREVAKQSCIKESCIAMRVSRLRKKLRKICAERHVLWEQPSGQYANGSGYRIGRQQECSGKKFELGSCQSKKLVIS